MAASGSSTGSANIPIGAQFSFFGNPRALSSGVKKQRSRLRKLTKQNVLGRSADRPCKFRPHCRLSPDSKHRNPLHPARKGPVNVLRSVRTDEPKQPTLLGRGTRNMRPVRTNRDLLKSDTPTRTPQSSRRRPWLPTRPLVDVPERIRASGRECATMRANAHVSATYGEYYGT